MPAVQRKEMPYVEDGPFHAELTGLSDSDIRFILLGECVCVSECTLSLMVGTGPFISTSVTMTQYSACGKNVYICSTKTVADKIDRLDFI